MSKVCMIVYNECTNDARVLKEARTLSKSGYEVTIFALKISDEVPYREEKNGFLIIRTLKNPGHLKLKRLVKGKKAGSKPSIPRESSTVKKSESHLRSLLRLGSRWLTLSSLWKKTYIDIIEEGEYDIIHAHDLDTLPVAERVARKQGAKLVYDSHEFYTDRNRGYRTYGWYLKRVRNSERVLIKKCDLVITVGYYIARELERMYNLPDVKVLLNAPAPLSDSVRVHGSNLLHKELNLPPDSSVLLYVGGITFGRGLEDVVRALPQIQRAHLVCMGYGKDSYMNHLRGIAENTGMRERFHFFGPVAPEMVAEYASSADIGIAPINNVCLSYYFCSPNKLFEYMQAGLPVASTDFPELRKYVTELEIGRTFQEDPADIARVINEMLGNPDALKRYAKNAKKEAKNYNWKVESKKLLGYYKELNESTD